jgi:hypothetical protein
MVSKNINQTNDMSSKDINLTVNDDNNVETEDKDVRLKGLHESSKYALNPENINKTSSKFNLSTVEVRKPNKEKFFRVMVGPEWEAKVTVIELKEDREFYAVDPSIAEEVTELVENPTIIKNVQLNVGVTMQGGIFLIPTPLPGEDGKWNSWHESLAEMVEKAKYTPIRLVPDMEAKGYHSIEALATAEINKNKIGKKTFWDIFDLAFKKRKIETVDHPVIKDLIGA